MERPHKIALIGAQGYERRAPQRIDCFQWDRLKADLNFRDYDTVILNLLSVNERSGWDVFCTAFDFHVVNELLQSNGQIIVLGDPRFSVITSANHNEQPFLAWTGLMFDWDDRSGDTVIINTDYNLRNFSPYLTNLRHWKYSLNTFNLNLECFRELFDLSKMEAASIHLVARQQNLCRNRYGKSLSFIASVALEERKKGYYETDTRTLSESGPIIFLPETDLDEDQTIITVLRDICGVESEIPEPEWIASIVAPGQSVVDDEIREITAKVQSLQGDRALAEMKRSETRQCLKLLFERGTLLEKAVREVLRKLGAHVEDPPEVGKEDGWITVQVAGQTLEGVLEIKSTKNDQFGEDGIRQLLDWRNRGIQLRQKKYKGIFIGNSAVEKPFTERAWPYSDSWKTSAELGELVALQSGHIYLIYVLSASGKLQRDDFWNQVFSTNGLFDMSPYIDLLIPKEKKSEG